MRSAQHVSSTGTREGLWGLPSILRSGFFSLLFSRYKPRWYSDWADVCMSRRQMSSKARLILARPQRCTPPRVRALNRDPPLALRYSHALARQICLCLPKYIRTSCPRFSPRNSFTPDHQHQKQQGTSYTSSLRLELATCTCAYLAQAHPLDHPLTRDRLYRRPLTTTTTTPQLSSLTAFYILTMPAQRPSHLPPCPGPPPSRPLPPLPK